jgi:predicted nucleotidyltransferase
MLSGQFGDNPAICEVFVFGSWAARYRDEAGAPPNDVDVVVVSDSLTRFDLAEARLDLETESKLSINLFVVEPDSERLPELRNGSVPVFERAPS